MEILCVKWDRAGLRRIFKISFLLQAFCCCCFHVPLRSIFSPLSTPVWSPSGLHLIKSRVREECDIADLILGITRSKLSLIISYLILTAGLRFKMFQKFWSRRERETLEESSYNPPNNNENNKTNHQKLTFIDFSRCQALCFDYFNPPDSPTGWALLWSCMFTDGKSLVSLSNQQLRVSWDIVRNANSQASTPDLKN